ncbi:MAG: alpha/beta fold hydrolase [Crocinitomicaceae bacterium]
MKRFLIFLLLSHATAFSQNISGDWSGEISISGMKLGFGMYISEVNGQFQSVMDIPEQKAMGIPMTSTIFSENKITIESKEMRGVFSGEYKDDKFSGTFSQNGASMPFSMTRGKYVMKVIKRPQEPKPSYDYEVREVTFTNKTDNVILAGTLTVPKGKGPFPAVVLVSGSGQQNRNSEILEHKPFLVIADYLTKNGIAVLRYDDRGVGGSNGNPAISTSANFALDAQAATTFLHKTKGINKKKIGIIGHSEGGMIAPMVAANPKNKIGFLVLLAGPAVSGGDILLEQQALISRANGESEVEIEQNRKMSMALFQFLNENKAKGTSKEELKLWVMNYFTSHEITIPESMTTEQMAETLANAYSNPWVQYFILHDPKSDLLKLKCPVLALNGAKDLQVPSTLNLTTFNKYAEISGNIHFTTKEFPDLNHLFQHCTTGSPNEYQDIEETFSPEVLNYFKDWIVNLK